MKVAPMNLKVNLLDDMAQLTQRKYCLHSWIKFLLLYYQTPKWCDFSASRRYHFEHSLHNDYSASWQESYNGGFSSDAWRTSNFHVNCISISRYSKYGSKTHFGTPRDEIRYHPISIYRISLCPGNKKIEELVGRWPPRTAYLLLWWQGMKEERTENVLHQEGYWEAAKSGKGLVFFAPVLTKLQNSYFNAWALVKHRILRSRSSIAEISAEIGGFGWTISEDFQSVGLERCWSDRNSSLSDEK